MRFLCIFILVVAVIFPVERTVAVKCKNGCETNDECPVNSQCVAATTNSECGLCLCKVGYKKTGQDCVPNKNTKTTKGGGLTTTPSTSAEKTTTESVTTSQATEPTTTTGAPTTTSTRATTASGPTTQGPPPTPTSLKCEDYACSVLISNSDSDNPFTVRAQLYNESSDCKRKLSVPGRACKMNGGGACYGEYCLTIEPGNDYCLCSPYRTDRQCAVEKPGKCEQATGQLSANAYKATNKRWRNKNNPDNGSVYGRHFAASLEDCIKLCQWAAGSCKAVNYGTLAGQKVCEMISALVTKGSLTEAWLVDAPGWQHLQVV